MRHPAAAHLDGDSDDFERLPLANKIAFIVKSAEAPITIAGVLCRPGVNSRHRSEDVLGMLELLRASGQVAREDLPGPGGRCTYQWIGGDWRDAVNRVNAHIPAAAPAPTPAPAAVPSPSPVAPPRPIIQEYSMKRRPSSEIHQAVADQLTPAAKTVKQIAKGAGVTDSVARRHLSELRVAGKARNEGRQWFASGGAALSAAPAQLAGVGGVRYPVRAEHINGVALRWSVASDGGIRLEQHGVAIDLDPEVFDTIKRAHAVIRAGAQ